MRNQLILVSVLLFLIAGCTSMIIEQGTERAIDATVERARFDLECRDVEATVVSHQLAEGDGPEASEDTISVRGCGREVVYRTTCPGEGDCSTVPTDLGDVKFAPQIEP